MTIGAPIRLVCNNCVEAPKSAAFEDLALPLEAT